MGFWRFMEYLPASGINPVRSWYDEQEEEIQAEFDFALHAQTQDRDWEDSPAVTALQGPYLGLMEICVDMEIDDEGRQFRAVGSFRPDNRDFVLFLVTVERGEEPDPLLGMALAYKTAWEMGDGELDEHRFF
jgi:hypothetical protein